MTKRRKEKKEDKEKEKQKRKKKTKREFRRKTFRGLAAACLPHRSLSIPEIGTPSFQDGFFKGSEEDAERRTHTRGLPETYM